MRGPQVNHLSVADDVIIFTSGKRNSLKLIMKTLACYEQVSAKLINKDKSHFMVPSNAFRATIKRVKYITGFLQKDNPITYLGFPTILGDKELSTAQS